MRMEVPLPLAILPYTHPIREFMRGMPPWVQPDAVNTISGQKYPVFRLLYIGDKMQYKAETRASMIRSAITVHPNEAFARVEKYDRESPTRVSLDIMLLDPSCESRVIFPPLPSAKPAQALMVLVDRDESDDEPPVEVKEEISGITQMPSY